MSDAELEYQNARNAYDAAVLRLRAAKTNRPPPVREPIPRRKRTHKEADAEKEACWQMYLGGEHDPKVLAKHFGHTVGWVHNLIRRDYRDRQFGPETYWEHRRRMDDEAWQRREAERLYELTMPED